MNIIYLSPSHLQSKKFKVTINNLSKCTIHFGAKGYEDYTIHKDKERKKRYIARHFSRENWNKSGICTAGFWSRWLLWEKATLQESIKYIEKKFNVNIIYKK